MCASDTVGDAFSDRNLETWARQQQLVKAKISLLLAQADMNLESPSATSTEAGRGRKHPPSMAQGVRASTVGKRCF